MRTRFVSIVSTGALLLTGSIAVMASAADQEDREEISATTVETQGDTQGVRDQDRLRDPFGSPERTQTRDGTHQSEDPPATTDRGQEQERDRDQSCDPTCQPERDRAQDRDRDRPEDGDGYQEPDQTRQQEQTRTHLQEQAPQQEPTRVQQRIQEYVQDHGNAPCEAAADADRQARNPD